METVLKHDIHCYPSRLADFLERGRIVVRPAQPEDLQLHMSFVRELSDRSRHSRFMSGVKELSISAARELSHVDHKSHVALLAILHEGSEQTMIAEARYAVDQDAKRTCEFAICVTDAWQRRGLGKNLLDRIMRSAVTSGLSVMRGETYPANRAMVDLAISSGFAVGHHSGMIEMKMPLASTL